MADSDGEEPEESEESEPEDPNDPAVRLREAREAVRQGRVEDARVALAAVAEDEADLAGERANLSAGLVFLEAVIGDEPAAAALLATARRQFLEGEMDAALQSVIESARLDRGFGDGLARRAMRLAQGTLGDTDMVDEYRRQLATLLY